MMKFVEKLLSYREFFKDLILPKEDVAKLIKNKKKVTKYEQILTLLFYIGTDCITFLEVVIETKDIIYEFQEKMNKDKELYDNLIDIEKYVEPKKEDNLDKIFSFIEALKIFKEEIKNDIKLIKFSSVIIEKYSSFYEEIDIDKLILLKQITQSIKQIDPKFDCKCNLDKKIHITGLKLIKNRKMKITQILKFIKNDIYYLDKNYNKTKYRPLDILDGIDLSLIEDKKDFFKNWNNINFYPMFDTQFEAFSKKIASLITEMKDFGYLFKFFQFGQEKPRKESIKAMQNKFIEILPTYNNKICFNFIEDAVELIFFSDKKNVDIKKFLSDIEKNLNVKLVNDIYISLTEKHKDLSKECNKIIVKYFTENKENSDPVSLAYLIDKCNNIRDDIFSNINKYTLTEEDIFSQNETNNYKLFRELVNRNIIQKVQNKKQKYIVDAMRVIASLLKKIEENEIQFNILFPYFKEGGYTEEKLKKKISIIFFNNEEATIKYFEILKSKVLTLITIKEHFTLVCRYFMNFYPNVHKDDINNITKIILDLESKSLNFFELHYKKEYDKYKEYLDNAEKSLEKTSSAFYNKIFNDSKKKYKDDDIKCVEETEKQFNKLQKLFEKEGIDEIDEKFLEACTKSFIEDKKKIVSELEKLTKIFKIPEKNNEIEDIKNNILLIVKREYILKALSSIIFLIYFYTI